MRHFSQWSEYKCLRLNRGARFCAWTAGLRSIAWCIEGRQPCCDDAHLALHTHFSLLQFHLSSSACNHVHYLPNLNWVLVFEQSALQDGSSVRDWAEWQVSVMPPLHYLTLSCVWGWPHPRLLHSTTTVSPFVKQHHTNLRSLNYAASESIPRLPACCPPCAQCTIPLPRFIFKIAS